MLDEADRAAISLGDAIRLENITRESGERPRLTGYVVRCVFCHRDHVSDFWDEIEEGIMAHRDDAPAWRKGTLADFGQRETIPCIPAEYEIDSQV